MLIDRMLSLPRVRGTVLGLDGKRSVVLTIATHLEAAIARYAEERPQPEFAILDNVDAAPERVRHQAFSARDKSRLFGKNLVLYVPSLDAIYQWTGFMTAYRAADALGLQYSLFVDAGAFKNDWHNWALDPLPLDYFEANRGRIERAYDALCDDDSKTCFAGALKSRLSGDTGWTPISRYEQYFHPKVPIEKGDYIIEGGIESGDSTLLFSQHVGPTGRVFAFEPISRFVTQLTEKFATTPNVYLEPKGLWSEPAEMQMEFRGGGSRIAQAGDAPNTETCQFMTIDDFVSVRDIRCDVIKLDIEGAELPALQAAVKTIRTFRPKLSIALYHAPFAQFIDIIEFIQDLDSDYDFYMGHHSPLNSETILYAMPKPKLSGLLRRPDKIWRSLSRRS